jgi:hypothetical protein
MASTIAGRTRTPSTRAFQRLPHSGDHLSDRVLFSKDLNGARRPRPDIIPGFCTTL